MKYFLVFNSALGDIHLTDREMRKIQAVSCRRRSMFEHVLLGDDGGAVEKKI